MFLGLMASKADINSLFSLLFNNLENVLKTMRYAGYHPNIDAIRQYSHKVAGNVRQPHIIVTTLVIQYAFSLHAHCIFKA